MQETSEKELVSIEGVLESIVFSSQETHFTVARLRQDENKSCVTIVGTIMNNNEGERLKVTGSWQTHPKYGRQLNIHHFEVVLPTEKEAVEKYLSGGIIKGIGPSMAKRIVKVFGEKTFDILDNDPGRLLEVEGIGKKKSKMILDSWKAQRSVHESMLFLSNYGVRGARAARIYQRYGGNLVAILKHHPYRLAMDIDGIGFTIADRIALKTGIAEDDPERIQAAMIHAVNEASAQGHCYLPQEKLIETVSRMLRLEADTISPQFDVVPDPLHKLDLEGNPIYLKKIFFQESQVGEMLHGILRGAARRSFPETKPLLEEVERKMGIRFRHEQQEAIEKALTEKICVITGGPGVGKTTLIKALVAILNGRKYTFALAAPTGRAAKRLTETSGFQATTIHRLLKFNPHSGKFEYCKNQPLSVDHLIIDETSMVDISLAYHLLSAMPRHASVTFIGDADQLPSVGPGNFLSDLIQSGRLPVFRLTHIFRQSHGSSIVQVAHEVNAGNVPQIVNHPSSDIFFMPVDSPMDGARLIVELSLSRLPKKYGFNPCTEIQVLTPMYKGEVGADNLNALLADALNEHGRSVGGNRFREGDKIMQIVNNYEKDVYNGDIGLITSCNRIEKTVNVNFDGRGILYQEHELDELVRAYAISIHKSQGSEYPAVIIPLFTEHYIMLERNLLYTAITRGKQLVVMVGSWRALQIAVKTYHSRNRYTRLAAMLNENTQDKIRSLASPS